MTRTATSAPTGAPTGARATWWVARTVTEVLSPIPVVAVTFLALGLHTGGLAAAGLLILFACVVPYAVVLYRVRAGTVTDHHIVRREQRRGPMFLGCASTVAGLVGAVLLGAPREVVAGGLAVFGAALVATVVNGFWWKLSVHAAASAGCVAILALAFGPWLLAGAAAVALNGWSRVYLRVHTLGQVLTGAATGTVVSGLVYALTS